MLTRAARRTSQSRASRDEVTVKTEETNPACVDHIALVEGVHNPPKSGELDSPASVLTMQCRLRNSHESSSPKTPSDRKLVESDSKATRSGSRAKAPRGAKTERPDSVAAQGLLRGQRAVHRDSGLTVRVLEDVPSLLQQGAVSAAMKLLASGGDEAQARNLLRHDDSATVRSLIKQCLLTWRLPIPAEYAVEDLSVLSASSLSRVTTKTDALLPCSFVLEDTGQILVDGLESPLCPLNWAARRFADGLELHRQMSALPNDSAAAPIVTYALAVLAEPRWLSHAAMQDELRASEVHPTGLVTLQYEVCGEECGNLAAFFVPLENFLLPACHRDLLFRAVSGRRLVGSTQATATLLMAAPAHVVNAPSEERGGFDDHIEREQNMGSAGKDDGAATTTRQPGRYGEAQAPRGWAQGHLFAPPTKSARLIAVHASLLQKALRRGRALCGPEVVAQALRALVVAEPAGTAGASGTRALLWTLTLAVFADAAPYTLAVTDATALRIPELVALTLLAQADPAWRLPSTLRRRVAVTALRLQAMDAPTALEKWRGWGRSAAGGEAVLTAEHFARQRVPGAGADVSDIVSAAQCAALVLCGPADAVDNVSASAILRRYLGSVPLWAPQAARRRLPPLAGDAEAAALEVCISGAGLLPAPSTLRVAGLNLEAQVAACDHAVCPSLLLFFQAALPCLPRDPQHTLAKLAQLLGRCSSGANARALRGGLTVANLARVEQFQAAADALPQSALEAEGAPGLPEEGRPAWASMTEALTLSRHEARLLGTVQRLQRDLAGVFFPDVFPSPQRSHGAEGAKVEEETAAVGDRGAGMRVWEEMQGAGRMPSEHEARTAFLQLFGAQERLEAQYKGESGQLMRCFVAVTLAGSVQRPFLVQRVSKVQGRADELGIEEEEEGEEEEGSKGRKPCHCSNL
ncbi:hypothetical protein CYMTET_21492 [Cymbomonas tetramitiformis]|uniref:Uncharacterized protein n=1 Tax=Cymbomonas tetramitiformis TaxID=36881 RepID=A0AAE0L381_9CHLO|nr:hypothetical protein CYMTET_21492 [Cymbomonas tetramitiformis]